MPPPRVTFSPQEGRPGCGRALKGRKEKMEVAPMQKSLYLSLFLVFSKRGIMRKGHPLSSEAVGHPGPLGSRRWRRPGRTQG